MSQQNNIVSFTLPLKQGDCLAIHSEHTSGFMRNIHCHEAYELHLIKGAGGAKRIIGDAIDTITDLELVLLAQPNLPHVWQRGTCKSAEHFVLQVYFLSELFAGISDKSCFDAIRHMLETAASGLVFSNEMTMRVYQDLMYLAATEDGLQQYTLFLNILNRLASDTNAKRIVGPGYVRDNNSLDNDDVAVVKDYIHEHYQEEIYIKTLADLIGVEQEWLSASFKNRTGNTVIDYVNQVRLGQVIHRLINTDKPIAQISAECGFTNLANFNRHFKRTKGITPFAFRREYRTSKI